MKHSIPHLAALVLLALALESQTVGASVFRRKAPEIGLKLSEEDTRKIGARIWRNECGGTVEGLTSWNRGEDFASLGIGHFIWYPAGKEGPFDESWPKLVEFLKKKGVAIPAWVLETPDCPWRSYEEFHAATELAPMVELRNFLARTVDLQTEFIVERLRAALPRMTEAAGMSRGARRQLETRFSAVAETGQGMYAMIDYVNFKGEGVKVEERYRGQGWGLAQVLLEMRGQPGGAAAAEEFAESAKRVLQRRIANAPRDESQWRQGWMNRCESYKVPL